MDPILRSRYVLIMRIFTLVYLVGAALFFFLPQKIFLILNFIPTTFGVLQPIPESSEHFWLILAVSMMTMLAALSLLSSLSPQIHGYAFVHILSKLVSSGCFLFLFLKTIPYFAYLAGIIVDFPIAILVFWITMRIMISKRRYNKKIPESAEPVVGPEVTTNG